MFRRDVYRTMEPVLRALDATLLEANGFALGGATRIALAFGELRESRDLDFLASDATGYAQLRARVRNEGASALFRGTEGFTLPRDASIDQYAIRFPVLVAGISVKVEFVRKARIQLGAPVHESFADVPCLALDDVWTEKLLANSDRGGDTSQLHRDVLDLGVLRQRVGVIPDASWRAAEGAYGAGVRTDLHRVLRSFLMSPAHQERALRGLRVEEPEFVIAGVRRLAEDLGVELGDG